MPRHQRRRSRRRAAAVMAVDVAAAAAVEAAGWWTRRTRRRPARWTWRRPRSRPRRVRHRIRRRSHLSLLQGRQGRPNVQLRRTGRRRRSQGQRRHRLRQGQRSSAGRRKGHQGRPQADVQGEPQGHDDSALVKGTSGASTVVLVPGRPGTGVTAGKSVRPCVELAGITDILTKAYGSTSPKNLVKATMAALHSFRTATRSKTTAA